MSRLLLLALALAGPGPLCADAPEVLQKEPGTPGAHWDPLDFADLTNTPTTTAGYGITDALSGDVAIVRTYTWADDSSPFEAGQNVTVFWANAGSVRGMECDVLTAPNGGDITLDLLVGNPPVSVYPAGTKPQILDGETSTLEHLPEALAVPVNIAKRDRLQIQVVSAPVPNYASAVETVGDLPDLPQAGTNLLVLSDGHVWAGRDYGYSYTNLGLAPGLSGAAATVVALPSGIAAGLKYLVDANDHVYTSNGDNTWTDSGTLTATGIWAGNTIATVSALNYPAPPGSTFLALDSGNLWRNDYAIWTDIGLPDSSGLGLRCNVYVYNLPNDD